MRVAVVTVAVAVVFCLGGLFHDRRLGRENHPRDRRRVQHRRAGDLDGVNDAVGNQIAVGQRGGVETVAGRQLGDLVHHHRAVQPGVGGDPVQR